MKIELSYILVVIGLTLLVGCSQSDDTVKVVEEHKTEQVKEKAKGDDARQLVVDYAFVKALPPGQTRAAVYLLLKNKSKTTHTLNYVHTPIAENVEVHRTIYEDGVMRMRQVKHLSINPNEKLVFEPGGYHLMLFGVSEELTVGQTFPLTMEFQGEVIDLLVEVRSRS